MLALLPVHFSILRLQFFWALCEAFITISDLCVYITRRALTALSWQRSSSVVEHRGSKLRGLLRLAIFILIEHPRLSHGNDLHRLSNIVALFLNSRLQRHKSTDFHLHQAISAPFFSVIRSTGLLPEYLLSILFPASYGRRALLPAHNCSSRAILTCSAVFISYTASLRDRFVSYRRIHTDARAPPCVIVYWCVVSGLNCLSLLRFGGWSTQARLHDAGAPRVPPPVKGDAFCRGPPSTSTEFTGMK